MKKVIALLLALIMLVGVMPMSVFAAEEDVTPLPEESSVNTDDLFVLTENNEEESPQEEENVPVEEPVQEEPVQEEPSEEPAPEAPTEDVPEQEEEPEPVSKTPITIYIEGETKHVSYNGEKNIIDKYEISEYDEEKISIEFVDIYKLRLRVPAETEEIAHEIENLFSVSFDSYADGIASYYVITNNVDMVKARINELAANPGEDKEPISVSYDEPEVCQYRASGVDVGTYKTSLSKNNFVVKSDEYDVTLEISQGILYIDAASVQITANSKEKKEDGTALSDGDWSITKGTLFGDDAIEVTVEGEQTEEGESENKITEVKMLSGKKDNYRFECVSGSLTVLPGATPLTISSASKDYVYSGKSRVADEYKIEYGKKGKEGYAEYTLHFGEEITLPSGDLLHIGTKDQSSRIYVGETENSISYDLERAENYKVTLNPGTIKITKAKLVITAGSDIYKYSGDPNTCDEYRVNGLLDVDEIVSVDIKGIQTEVGKSNNVASNAKIVSADDHDLDTTFCYDIQYVNGEIEVVENLGHKVVNVVDESAGKSLEEKEEIFFEDRENYYIFDKVKSDYIIVYLADGSNLPIISALYDHYLSIEDFAKYGISFTTLPKDNADVEGMMFGPKKALLGAASGTVTISTDKSNQDGQYRIRTSDSGFTDSNTPKHYVDSTSSGIVAYCLQHKKENPKGTYKVTTLEDIGNHNGMTGLSSKGIAGVKAILSWGYPFNEDYGLTKDYYWAGTQQAIRFWLGSVCGVPVSYKHYTQLSSSYSSYDDLYNDVSYHLKVQNSSYSNAIKYVADLLWHAYKQDVMKHSISASDIVLEWDGTKYTGTVDVKLVNITSGWSVSSVPEGLTVKKSGNSLIISCGEDFVEGTVKLKGKDRRASDNILAYYPSYSGGSDDQCCVMVTSEPSEYEGSFKVSHVQRNGKLKIVKVSANPDCTNGNALYSLAGAEYTLYSEEECITPVLTLVTDETGTAIAEDVDPGTYWLKETKASEGFKMNTGKQEVPITLGKTTVLNGISVLVEKPLNDPVAIRIKKNRPEGATGYVGEATLAGAIFKVEYYDTLDELTGKSPDRTWYFKTNNQGRFAISQEYFDHGDDLFIIAGVVGVPLGTIVVTEYTAPAGYLLNTDFKYTLKIESNGEDTKTIVIGQDVDPEDPHNYGLVEMPIVGSLDIHKYLIDYGKYGIIPDEDAKRDALPEAGAVFEIHDSTGALVYTLITDENGYASQSDIPFGTYSLTQKSGTEGFQLIRGEIRFEVGNDILANHFEYDLYNDRIYAQIEIHKIDVDTGEYITYSNAKFRIRNVDTGEYVSFEDVSEFVTDNTGKVTLPGKLPFGNYELCEIEAPFNYTLADNILFSVDNTSTEEGLNLKVTLDVPDKLVRGKVKVYKKADQISGIETVTTSLGTDSIDVSKLVFENKYLADVTFELIADEDIYERGQLIYSEGDLVERIVTISSGPVESSILPLGKYILREVDCADEYILDSTDHNIDLKFVDNDTEIVIDDEFIENDWRDLKVVFVKKGEILTTITSEDVVDFEYPIVPLGGVVFGLYSENDIRIGNLLIPADTLLATATSSADGLVVFNEKLPSANYYIKELYSTNWKYIENNEKYPVSNIAATQSEDDIVISFGEPIINRYVRKYIKITKTDITGELGLPDATLEIEDENGVIIYRQKTGEDGALEEIELIPGDYILREVYSPNGYSLSSEEVEFSIDHDGNITGETTMKDDITRFSFYKQNESGDPIEGAEFTMYDADGNVYSVAYSDGNGIVTFENLMIGKYYIKETMTLEEYQLSEDVLTLVVTNRWMNDMSYTEGGELIYSITNYNTIITGDELTLMQILPFIAFPLAVAGIVFLIIRKKKRK